MPKSIYLAGPEVFFPNAFEVLQQNKELCAKKGYLALTPFDGDVPKNLARDTTLAKTIFEENCKLIDRVDLIIANCNFFRGACIDDGTAFEIGYGFATRKEIWGYRNDLIPLHIKTKEIIPVSPHDSGYLMDSEGYLLNEDFGNSINLMLEYSIQKSGGKLVQGGLEEVLEEIYHR
ncbi:MAG: nucleoside 2-deoxyribosyltransferase [Leptospira sp.]|nr:nucleoside 2-deoxyribosyltransferase [Leptospira sp.]